jgi:hypothetical protein
MVEFLEHFLSPYHHHSQLAQVICLVSVSIHQQRDNHQKISPIMDEDDTNQIESNHAKAA